MVNFIKKNVFKSNREWSSNPVVPT